MKEFLLGLAQHLHRQRRPLCHVEILDPPVRRRLHRRQQPPPRQALHGPGDIRFGKSPVVYHIPRRIILGIVGQKQQNIGLRLCQSQTVGCLLDPSVVKVHTLFLHP